MSPGYCQVEAKAQVLASPPLPPEGAELFVTAGWRQEFQAPPPHILFTDIVMTAPYHWAMVEVLTLHSSDITPEGGS